MLICIDAGHYLGTPGKRCLKSIDPNETREWVLNGRIADKVQALLAAYDCRTARTDDPTGQREVTLDDRVEDANDAKADVLVSIHHNAGVHGGSGGGIVVYINPSHQPQSKVVQEAIYRHLIAQTGLKGNRASPMAQADHQITRETTMPAVLCECGFMDSTVDTPIILTEEFANQAARGITDALVEVYGLKKTGTSGSLPSLCVPVSPAQFSVELVDMAKRSVTGSFANAGYFSNYSEQGEPFTLPVAHLRADYKASGPWSEKYCKERGRFDGDRFTFDSHDWSYDNPFYRKKITTLLVGDGKAEVQEVDTVPEWADYAVSGIPLLRNGQAVAQADILAQGWDTSPLRATWHTVVGLKGDGKIYVMGWQSTTSNLVTSGKAAASFRAMGFTDVVKLDGGGSFSFQTAQGGQKTSENRRINSVLRFGGADEQPQEPEQPALDPDYEKWKSYMARWEAEKAALPVSDWAKELLAEAVAMGITDGTRPQAPATRQEVALMVRAGNAQGKE